MHDLQRESKRRMTRQSITGVQLRLGRLGIGWTQEALADRANVSRDTVSALEGDSREVLPNNRDAVVGALKRGGASFEVTEETLTVVLQRAAVERPVLEHTTASP